jgi:hypothetical protein
MITRVSLVRRGIRMMSALGLMPVCRRLCRREGAAGFLSRWPRRITRPVTAASARRLGPLPPPGEAAGRSGPARDTRSLATLA